MKKKVIAFDADDTLWHNEPYFEEAQEKFSELFQNYASKQELAQQVYLHQVKNLPMYGFGIKAFILSMIETAITITNHQLPEKVLEQILKIGKDLLEKPVELLPEVEKVLKELNGDYKLIVATKGDLKDQHRKLHDSGIGHYFHHIEVMIDKMEIDYQKMLQRLEIDPEYFIMIGNSLKSDVLPVLEIGGTGIHIPYHTTWAYERIDFEIQHSKFWSLQSIDELIPWIQKNI